MSLLALVAREAQVRSPASAAEVPRPQRGLSTRPPAVAGSFYPAEAGDLARIVDGLLPAAIAPPERWPAVMVPHAGLRFSGAIAAAVYARVVIPDVVIIVAPRHHLSFAKTSSRLSDSLGSIRDRLPRR